MLSADNVCKQVGRRSGVTKLGPDRDSKLFDTLIVFLKKKSEKMILETAPEDEK